MGAAESGGKWQGLPLATPRLTLRPARAADAADIVPLAGDIEVSRTLARVPHPYTADHAQAWLQAAMDGTDLTTINLVLDRNDAFIGSITFRELHASPLIGYWLGRPFWGQGLMSEALKAALGWFFAVTDHEALEAEVMTGNAASLAALRRLGFRETGTGTCASLATGTAAASIRTRLERARFLESSDA